MATSSQVVQDAVRAEMRVSVPGRVGLTLSLVHFSTSKIGTVRSRSPFN